MSLIPEELKGSARFEKPVFSMYDERAKVFMTPSVDESEATAYRNFEHAVVATRTILNSHPSDFSLYKIGIFDQVTGKITAIQPELIVKGSDFGEVKINAV